MRKLVVLIVLVAGMVLVAQAPGAGGPVAKPPNATVHGATLAEWAERFFAWEASIGVVNGSHPSLDTGDVDCGIEQRSQKVWFLTTFDLFADELERRCTVPTGTMLYVPVIQWICSPDLFGEEVDECLAAADFAEIDLSLSVDGRTLDNAALQSYRAVTGAFELPLVEGSLWEQWFGELPDSITFGSEAVGALVGPLSAGRHDVVISAACEVCGFDVSFTYELTVSPPRR